MSHRETHRMSDGASSRFVIDNAEGGEMIVAQRDRDLMRIWVSTHGDEPAMIAVEDALAFADWMTEARKWL
jgi:hypothetical protein